MAVDKESIYNQIKNAITTTELAPNTKLDDSFLMKRYKITRTPLREILIRLQSEGLVNIVPRMGTTVAPLDLGGLREIVEMRKNLDDFAVQLAAKRRKDSHLKTLKKIIDSFRESKNKDNVDYEMLLRLDSEFHNTIYEAADNSELTRCAGRMRLLMLRYWYSSGFGGMAYFSNFNSLERILEGIENQDGNLAQKATKEHIEDFIDKLKEIIK